MIPGLLALAGLYSCSPEKGVIRLSTPMDPPEWAVLERQILEETDAAAEEFYAHFFDERGYLEHVARWGALDGCDDAMENFKNWTIYHALGGSDRVLELAKKGIEGTYLQYSAVTTTATHVAAEGCYYREFMPMSDFMHQAEGYQGLMHLGLSEPDNPPMADRFRRFAGLYMNEDPHVRNYDPQHQIIRSFWTGSKGPMLREGTAFDWAGDHTEGVFHLLHHRDGTSSMRDYGKEYPGIVHHFYYFPQSTAGDHPLNLCATQLALNAYMLEHEDKYKNWLLEYAGAWRERAVANGGNFPSNVGLDGRTGNGVAGHWYHDRTADTLKWYMGTYGWNFSFFHWTKKTYHENNIFWGIWPGMGNAYLISGDPSYVDALRSQMTNILKHEREIDGQQMVPRNYGLHLDRDHPRKFDVFEVKDEKLYIPDGQAVEGWYNWTPYRFTSELIDIWLMSMSPDDLQRIPPSPWIDFLQGRDPGYPRRVLKAQLNNTRKLRASLHNDPTTAETRLADWSLQYNPVDVGELLRLMLGGNLSGRIWTLHTRVRYFDPQSGRAGLPKDVAALVTGISGDSTKLVLVNLDPEEKRELVVQTGAYGEHECRWVKLGNDRFEINNNHFLIRLDPGSGSEITVIAERYARAPGLKHPSGIPGRRRQ